ncbi:hypothetical protein B566_EDAN011390 [Ephemera danica]|nr:hypothetical protein B566_EDAN011390 [Ephemera danica]
MQLCNSGDVDSNKGCVSVFLIYRWLLALYFLCALGVSIAEPRFLGKSESGERRAKWPVYLTNWAYVLLTSHVTLAAVLATKHHLNLGKPAEAMTLLHKTYWVFNNVSNALAPCISLCYWIILFNPTHPIRLLHCYQPVLVALAYTIFSAAYFLAGGTNRDNSPNIYPILNWGDHPWPLVRVASACTTQHCLTKATIDCYELQKRYHQRRVLSQRSAPGPQKSRAFQHKSEKHILGFTNITNHVLNSVITIVDLFIAAHPIRLLHIIHPILVSLTYIAFSGVYYVAGGTNRDNSIAIYPILNWSDNPGRTLVLACALTMFLVPVHLVIWSLYLIRRRIATIIMTNQIVDTENNVEAGQVKN